MNNSVKPTAAKPSVNRALRSQPMNPQQLPSNMVIPL
jgi:hypothetical protein